MNEDRFRKLISGQARGPFAFLLRGLLKLLSCIYGQIIRIRNLAYNIGWIRVHNAPIPVISVGNLTTGGTGKTPLVIWIIKCLHEKGLSAAVLTRGYKTEPGKISDEPAILAKSCHGAEIVVDPDRVRGISKALRHDCKVVVMDDGFQHRRLNRDLDILTIDATCPFGFGHLLPAGFLREPLSSIKRADIVVLTRSDQVKPDQIERIRSRITAVKPDIPILKTRHTNPFIRIHRKGEFPIEDFRERKVFAFCGIGNPSSFLERLEALNLTLVGKRVFNDHYNYRPSDISKILDHAGLVDADLILTTQKDWVKTALLMERNCQKDFGYLALELDFLDGNDTIVYLIEKIIQDQG